MRLDSVLGDGQLRRDFLVRVPGAGKLGNATLRRRELASDGTPSPDAVVLGAGTFDPGSCAELSEELSSVDELRSRRLTSLRTAEGRTKQEPAAGGLEGEPRLLEHLD